MTPSDVLDFWFGPLDADQLASRAKQTRWFTKDPAFDAQVTEKFGALWSDLMRDVHPDWCDEPEPLLAYVIVLDQFSRNMFRGKPQSFAGDAKALSAARRGIKQGHDRSLALQQRVFLYMPFMHSEKLADQEECVALFTALRDEAQGPARAAAENNVQYALRHRDVVARWGRFPHRNQILDRTSTNEEFEFLKQPNSSF